MSTLFVRSVITETRPPSHSIGVRLDPWKGFETMQTAHFEPAPLFAVVPYSDDNARARLYGMDDVVFGVSDGENVFMTAYLTREGRKQLTVYRDGGTMEVTKGVPTTPGPKATHLFAIFGNHLLTPAMRDSTETFVKLTQAQILRVFRDQPQPAFRAIAPSHARAAAMRTLRRVRSKSRGRSIR